MNLPYTLILIVKNTFIYTFNCFVIKIKILLLNLTKSGGTEKLGEKN